MSHLQKSNAYLNAVARMFNEQLQVAREIEKQGDAFDDPSHRAHEVSGACVATVKNCIDGFVSCQTRYNNGFNTERFLTACNPDANKPTPRPRKLRRVWGFVDPATPRDYSLDNDIPRNP